MFGLVLVAALVLRILVALAFRPIMWFGGDSASYLATGLRLIPDPARVGGYGFMLWVLRPLPSSRSSRRFSNETSLILASGMSRPRLVTMPDRTRSRRVVSS